MPTTDREVFQRFVDDPGMSREEALLAFASYAAEKYDWIAHAEQRDGTAPSSIQIERWISDLSTTRLKGIQDQAVAAFDEALRAYAKPMEEAAAKEAVERSILAEVKRATSFRATFWPNLVIGVAASFAFALIVLGTALIADKDPSLIATLKRLHNPPAAAQ